MDYNSLNVEIHDALEFLKQFDWIHSFQVTRIFETPLQDIPEEWAEALLSLNTEQLNSLPFLEELSFEKYPEWPLSLHKFLSVASRLSLDRQQQEWLKPTPVGHAMGRGMNPKKLHEVSYLASLVDSVVRQADCNLIVDVGSGLGYLDHVLHQAYSHSVIGLETSAGHVCRAENRAAAQGLQCGGIRSIKCNLTNDVASFENFESVLSNHESIFGCKCKSNNPGRETLRVCVVGLHCCGDLSPTMLAMFDALPSIKALCFVSCCYHKMAFSSHGVCSHFPLSAACKEKISSLMAGDPSWVIQPPTLRLGAQETRSRWKKQSSEDYDNHTRHVAYRGLLELIDCKEPALRRNLVRKCNFSSFEAFLDSYLSPLKMCEVDAQRDRQALLDLYSKHKDNFGLIEPLTALQMVIQPVIEGVIYKDRLCWLLEKGYSKSQIIPVFDETISPRNLAIVAYK